MKITPSITSFYFTKGKIYNATFCNEPKTLVMSFDDNGLRRIISYPFGNRYPHLKNIHSPNGISAYEVDKWEWDNAGHWILVQ